MSKWKSVRLKDVASNASRAFDFRSKATAIFINTGDVLDGYFLHNELSDLRSLPGQAKKAIRKGDILYSEIRPGNGRHALVQQDLPDYVVSTKFMVLESKPGMLPEFLYHVLKSPECESEFKLIAESRSGTFPQITFDAVSHYEFQLPPLDEQRAIALILGTLDDKIELNRRTNETLEAMARAIFKSWFVDFDPVRAKASGEPPESICRRLGLSPDVLALFPDSFQDSEFGEIPASWYISTLATEAKRFGGFIQTGPFGSQLHAADYVDEGVPVVMPQDLVNRRISVERIARVTAEMAQRLSRHSVKPGDVVYSRRGDVERHALVSEREAGWLCGTGCLLVRLGDAWPSQAYLSEVLDLPVTREWLVRHAVGATMPNLNTTILGNMPFLIPSESLLHAFESIAGPLRKLQIDKCVESDLLAVTRDTLLPKLLSGELSPNRVSVESLP